MRPQLYEHLKALSAPAATRAEMVAQWTHLEVEEAAEACHCPCTQRIKFRHLILNNATGEETYVGSECIRHIDNAEMVRDAERALRGITHELCYFCDLERPRKTGVEFPAIEQDSPGHAAFGCTQAVPFFVCCRCKFSRKINGCAHSHGARVRGGVAEQLIVAAPRYPGAARIVSCRECLDALHVKPCGKCGRATDTGPGNKLPVCVYCRPPKR
eukprot:m.265592 g.265592  ORF g.265592 m.265592 type:complete len:214 (+) comp11062_c1_seq7:1167-1808(+)